MSTKTPSLQTRSQYGRDWGNYASLAVLPNSSSNALANPYFSQLEVGDVAYVTGTSQRAVCTAVGTVAGSNATWVPIGGGSTSNVLWEWNGVDTSQFDMTPTVTGAPLNPTLAVVNGALVLSMDEPTVGLASAAWFINDPVPWASVRTISFCVTNAGGGADAYFFGVAAAADGSLGTSITYLVAPTDFSISANNGGSPPATLLTLPITRFAVQPIEIKLFANSLTTGGTFVPNGVPTYVGSATIYGNATIEGTAIYSIPALGFAGTDWGPAVPEQIAVTLTAPAGVADPAGLKWAFSSIQFLS